MKLLILSFLMLSQMALAEENRRSKIFFKSTAIRLIKDDFRQIEFDGNQAYINDSSSGKNDLTNSIKLASVFLRITLNNNCGETMRQFALSQNKSWNIELNFTIHHSFKMANASLEKFSDALLSEWKDLQFNPFYKDTKDYPLFDPVKYKIGLASCALSRATF